MAIEILNSIIQHQQQGKKQFALLIDPDKVDDISLNKTIDLAVEAKVDWLFVGGSLLTHDSLDQVLTTIKSNCTIPTILFPGSTLQINNKADAIFFLSLISGRNPELLIGQQVLAAPFLKKSNLQILPTGYILIDGGVPTTVSYISNTLPIPANKPDIAACTAIAGEMLGLKLIYLDAGSGAKNAIPAAVISAVKSQVNVPIIVGGGITSVAKAQEACVAGADIIVVGNAVEKNTALIAELAATVHQCSKTLVP
jgi:phosphoglycerol geranylgeranyltransferase